MRSTRAVKLAALSLASAALTPCAFGNNTLNINDFDKKDSAKDFLKYLERPIEGFLFNGTSFSFGPNSTGLRYQSSGFSAAYNVLNFDGRSSINSLSFDGGFNFGSGRLNYSGFNFGDGDSGFNRQKLGFASSGLELNIERLSVDSDFNRLNDLSGANDAEKKHINDNRGFDRMDMSAKFSGDQIGAKGLSLQTNRYSAKNDDTGITNSGYQDIGNYQVSKNTNLSFINEGRSSDKDGNNIETSRRQNFALTHNTKDLSFSGSFNSSSVTTGTGPEAKTQVNSFNLTALQLWNLNANAEFRNYSAGDYSENGHKFNFSLKPSAQLLLSGSDYVIERSAGESLRQQTWNFDGNFSPNLRVWGQLFSSESSIHNDHKLTQIHLAAKPAKQVAVTGSYIEDSHETLGDRVTVSGAISTSTPIKVGANFTETKIATETGNVTEKKMLQASVSGEVGGSTIAVETVSSVDSQGKEHNYEAISFARNKENEKLKIKLSYKNRDSDIQTEGDYSLQLNAKYDLSGTSYIQINHQHLPEDQRNKINPIANTNAQYFKKVGNELTLKAEYDTSFDYRNDYRVSSYSLGVFGKLDNGATLSAMFGAQTIDDSFDVKTLPMLGLIYDHKLNDKESISFGADYRWNFGEQRSMWRFHLTGKIKF